MVLETTQQCMAWMEHGIQISLKNFAHLMEDKMLPGALGRAKNYEYNATLVNIIIKLLDISIAVPSDQHVYSADKFKLSFHCSSASRQT